MFIISFLFFCTMRGAFLINNLSSTYYVPETPPRTSMQGSHLYFIDKKLRLWEDNEYVLCHTARKWQNRDFKPT